MRKIRFTFISLFYRWTKVSTEFSISNVTSMHNLNSLLFSRKPFSFNEDAI